MISDNRYVTLFFCLWFGGYSIVFWNDPSQQFIVGLNAGFFFWALLQFITSLLGENHD